MRYRFTTMFAAAAVAALGITGCHTTETSTVLAADGTPKPIHSASGKTTTAPQTVTGNNEQGKVGATIFVVKTTEDGSSLVPRKVSLPAEESSSREERAKAIFGAMAKLSKEEDPLPKDTKLEKVVFDEDGTVTADLSGEFQSNFAPGDQNEALALNTITGTFAQFEGVRRVQILVDGQKIESLGGTQRIDKPLPVPQTVARRTAQ